jgi:hypothetical protein
MRVLLSFVSLVAFAPPATAQVQGKFPPDSLINTRVIPRETPVSQVIGTMRNFTSALGVRCQFCHLGEEGMPLDRFDFASDDKRAKQVARQMMRMVEEINHRLDTLPERPAAAIQVTCTTCHRGLSRPVPLSQHVQEVAMAFGADSAVRNYRALRERYYGRSAYDFGEISLNTAAFRLGREKKFEEALALLRLNEEFYPQSSALSVSRGNVLLIRGDTAAAAVSFREAIRRDSTNTEARGRLRDIGQQP